MKPLVLQQQTLISVFVGWLIGQAMSFYMFEIPLGVCILTSSSMFALAAAAMFFGFVKIVKEPVDG